MTKYAQPDFAKAFEEMIKAAPADLTAFNNAFKNTAEIGGKFGKIALEAAEKNAELSHEWTKDTLAKIEAVTKVQKDPTGYAKTVSEVAQEQAKETPERVAAFAEIVKQAQMETLNLILTAGKDAQNEAKRAMKKATR